MAEFLTEFITDLAKPPQLHTAAHQFAMGDNNAYTFTALVCNSAAPEAALLGGTVSGTLLRPDGATVALEGVKGESVQEVNVNGVTLNATPCSVTLPQACFAFPGRVLISIKLMDGTTATTVLAVTGTVIRTETDTAVDPGEIIPDLAELQAAAAEALEAADAANTAAEDAEAAASHAVRYDTTQSLTDAQKATAMTNIGVAFRPVCTLTKDCFEKGSLSGNPPVPESYAGNARMRTIMPLIATHDLYISISTQSYANARFICYIYADDMTSVRAGSWVTFTHIPAGTVFKLLVTPNTSASTNYSLDTIFGLLTISAVPPITSVSELRKDLFENGHIDAGNNATYAAMARIRTAGLLRAEKRFAVSMDTSTYANSAVILYHFDAEGQYTGDTGWTTEVVIEPGEIFRLLMTLDKTSAPGGINGVSVDAVFAGAYIDNDVGSQPSPVVVSHQGKTDGVENYCMLDGYIRAGERGFRAAELDVKRTSDGAIVCSHDPTFTDGTSGETITISSMTLAELRECNYHGGTIATFEEVIAVCKRYGMEVLIDQLSSLLNAANWNTMISIINKYRYMDKVWFICYIENNVSNLLLRVTKPRILFSEQWGSSDLSALLAFANSHASDAGEVGITFHQEFYTEQQIAGAVASMNPWYRINIYPFDTVQNKRIYAKYANYGTSNTNIALYPET